MNASVGFALGAAALFGLSTPLAKMLLGSVSPVMLGGLLYLGSGIGLLTLRIVRDRGWEPSGLTRSEWPWLAGAIAFGGILGPVALLLGLQQTTASTASLLLNLEGVLTAVLAWVAFKENADRRIVLGMLAIVAGGVILSWQSAGSAQGGLNWASLLIVLACLCWALDNNLTRKVALNDAGFIAMAKGLSAGSSNLVLAVALGAGWPGWETTLSAGLLGFLSYGASLTLFVLALRHLGASRTGAYFSVAPFFGALVSVLLLHEPVTVQLLVAAALMAWGVWLHLSEDHAHEHSHEALEHAHEHVHDAHHQHEHAGPVVLGVPHKHVHRHLPMSHSHAHFPDAHHRHGH